MNQIAEMYRKISKNFAELADLIEQESVVETPVTASETATKEEGKKQYTEEELSSMKYNDLKSLAKKLGVDPSGTREAITERILALYAPADEAEDEEEEEEEVKTKKSADEKMSHEEIAEYVEDLVKDMTDEEIADLLSEVGISPKGKRQALIAKVIKAIEDGLLEFEYDDEDEESGDVEDSADKDEDTDVEDEVDEVEDSEYEDSDGEDYFPEDMTDERKKACAELKKEITAEYKGKKLTDKEIKQFCSDFYLDHEGYDSSLPKDEQLDMYIQAQQRLIDDEGEQHDFQEPYELNGQNACCGHYLKELEDSGNLYCEVCGTEYETE